MKKILGIIFLSFFFISFLLPLSAQAFPYWGENGIVSCTGGAPTGGKNTCRSMCDVLATSKNALDFSITIALFVLFPVLVLIGGVLIMVGGGNPGLRSKGISYIRNSIIAAVIILSAFVLVNTFIKGMGLRNGYIKGLGDPITCESQTLNSPFIKTAFAQATTTVNIDTSIPGVDKDANPVEIIAGLYKFALGISAFLAIAVIVYGAIKYAASPGNTSAISDAREWITSALLGILLLASAYLILRTINPELTILKLPTLESIKISPSTGVSGGVSTGSGNNGGGRATGATGYGWSGATPPPGTLTHDQAVSSLRNAGIPTNHNYANCTYAGQTNCTSLTGIRPQAISGVIDLKNKCNCSVTVTGGTEAGHITHAMNTTILDLGATSDLSNYIKSITGVSNWTNYQKRSVNGVMYMWETSPPHWHVIF